jgi:uncharacterized protein involved in type VI secretion and phage assembly
MDGLNMMMNDLSQELLTWVRGHYFGKYRGTVSDNDDPTKRGRIKVKVPAVLGSVESWAMPCVPYAGQGVGFYSLPAVGTGVWVEFEAGDPSYPIWTGCFWADDELPDTGGAAIKIWKTDKLSVRIDDENDELKMETTSGSKVTLASDIQAESGEAKHTVGSDGVVSELGSGKVEVTSAAVKVNNGAIEVV